MYIHILCVSIGVLVYRSLSLSIYIYIERERCVHIYIYMYMYIYIQRERERERDSRGARTGEAGRPGREERRLWRWDFRARRVLSNLVAEISSDEMDTGRVFKRMHGIKPHTR